MSQSKKHSLLESVINVLSGYGIAIITQYAVFPVFGIHMPLHEHLLMGLLFTVVSIIRSYYVRRLFNWLHIKEILK